MSRFYAEITGGRGTVSRTGTAKSGMRAHIRGWDVGVEVTMYVGPDGEDRIEVRRTGGSNGAAPSTPLVTVTEAETTAFIGA